CPASSPSRRPRARTDRPRPASSERHQMSTPQSRRNLGAIAWMVTAVGVLSLMDGAMKWLAPHYPAIQVAAMRGMASLPVVVLWLAARGELGQVVRVRWVM